MRGKGPLIVIACVYIGITPAHAGKRCFASYLLFAFRDHPRACGEKCRALPAILPPLGSPPRMRGKVIDRIGKNRVLGITPAHAGKRYDRFSRAPVLRDHPRACGEKNSLRKTYPETAGSPPRMRGKVVRFYQTLQAMGITPAHAGKSQSGERACAGSWDHPRACGEKQKIFNLAAAILGSPPRMRGKVKTLKVYTPVTGITPAHAGKRGLCARSMRCDWDHPRACGEKSLKQRL